MTFNFRFITAVASLVGSAISAIACAFALFVYNSILPPSEVNVRTKLVINILIAEGLNALNNSASGYAFLFHSLHMGPACTANGYIGQVTVQAVDLNVLVLAIITYLVLTNRSAIRADNVIYFFDTHIAWVIGIIWLYPLLTASINFALVGYGPAGGNWCWIWGPDSRKTLIVRYALTHGLRIFIFLTCIVLYLSLAIYIYRETLQRSTRKDILSTIHDPQSSSEDIKSIGPCEEQTNRVNTTYKRVIIDPQTTTQRYHIDIARQKKLRDAIVRLIAFPVSFIVLWIPGITNRILDGFSPSDIAVLLQSLTQYIGFVHAFICLYNLKTVMLNRVTSEKE